MQCCDTGNNKMQKCLNKSTILRLARYLRVLKKLKPLGFVKVFSNNLGDAIGVTPSVVRKDFSMISIPGNKRGGYNIDNLITELGAVLGKNQSHDVVLAGCGRIGSALMEYKEFAKDGIRLLAGFDLDPARAGAKSIPVYDIKDMPEFIRSHNITVGIIAVPDTAAAQVLEKMTGAGIQGVLNFAPVELKGSGGCLILNVNLGLEIENLFYQVKLGDKQADLSDLN
ncbi:MAG: redox-sensing transcriptional repressor Rex [Spirochaetales bacterium]|nr:redox-sensing transcriptional repressor Rex [Spirochaetales bacterium]